MFGCSISSPPTACPAEVSLERYSARLARYSARLARYSLESLEGCMTRLSCAAALGTRASPSEIKGSPSRRSNASRQLPVRAVAPKRVRQVALRGPGADKRSNRNLHSSHLTVHRERWQCQPTGCHGLAQCVHTYLLTRPKARVPVSVSQRPNKAFSPSQDKMMGFHALHDLSSQYRHAAPPQTQTSDLTRANFERRASICFCLVGPPNCVRRGGARALGVTTEVRSKV